MARSSQLKGTSSFTDSRVCKTIYNETLLWKSMNKFRGSRQSTWTMKKEENKVVSLWEDSLDFITSWGIKTVFVAKVQRNDINNKCRRHLEVYSFFLIHIEVLDKLLIITCFFSVDHSPRRLLGICQEDFFFLKPAFSFIGRWPNFIDVFNVWYD